MKTLVRICLLICLSLIYSSASAQARLSEQEAGQLLIKSVEPIYPPLARMMKSQGDVALEITVSEKGSVTDVKFVSGNDVFKTAAIDAARKREYRPYAGSGKASSFLTTITFHFSLGIPSDQYEKDRKISDQFFPAEDRCRQFIRTKEWDKAEPVCRRALDLANQFPYERELEKMGAHRSLGRVLTSQKRYAEAIAEFQEARKVVQNRLTERDAEVGELYAFLALAHQLSGDLNNALDNYRRAEAVYKAAYDHFGLDNADEEIQQIRKRYLQTLKDILALHAQAAIEAKSENELAAVRKMLDSLP